MSEYREPIETYLDRAKFCGRVLSAKLDNDPRGLMTTLIEALRDGRLAEWMIVMDPEPTTAPGAAAGPREREG